MKNAYKNWTKESIEQVGLKIKELLPLAKREMMQHIDLLTISYYMSVISKAERTLDVLRREYKKK